MEQYLYGQNTTEAAQTDIPSNDYILSYYNQTEKDRVWLFKTNDIFS